MKKLRPKRRIDVAAIAGKFGPGVTVHGKKHEYLVGPKVGETLVCDLYRASPDVGDPALIKIVRDAEDNDLTHREQEILGWLAVRVGEGKNRFPVLVEAIDVFDEDGKRRALVFPYNPNAYTLAEIIDQYPQGVEPKHAAWMMNRMLEAIHYANYHGGVVHAALLPYNFVVDVKTHAGILCEWAFAARDSYVKRNFGDTQDTLVPGEDIKVIDSAYEAWYPPEVREKKPHNYSVDLWMFARVSMKLLGGDPLSGMLPSSVPKSLAGFLRYIVLQADPSKRPQEAAKLHDELQSTLKSLYGKRQFQHFHMPARA